MPRFLRADSLAVLGLEVPAGGSVLLKPVKGKASIKDGFLRVHNVSNEIQYLMPSKQAQEQVKNRWPEFEPEIEGDSSPASIPMAWENPTLKFEIISLNNSLLPGSERTFQNIEMFTEPGSMWSMQEIIGSVEALPGSKPPVPDNPDNYMGYDRTNWQVFNQPIRTGKIGREDVNGGIVTDEAILHKSYTTKEDEIAYVLDECFGNRTLAFVVRKSDGANYQNKTDSLDLFLDSIGTAGCISLLQKAIRRRPKRMRHPETTEKFATADVVERIARRMCCGKQTGFFLPDIGKFVTPLEHFLKRLFIIAAEDSEYDVGEMYFLSMKAYLAARLPHWKPSKSLVEKVVQISLRLLESSVTSHYKTSTQVAIVEDFVERAPAAVHEELGGMGGDQKMLRWLAKHKPERNRIGTEGQPLKGCDPLDIYCDQHQEGRLICFLENPKTDKPPAVFAPTMSSAFAAVSGWNTRRKPRQDMLTRKEKMVFDALCACSKMLRLKAAVCTETSDTVKKWTVPDGSLAGMVGSIEVTLDRAKYFVTVSVHDLTEFIIIPKPSRDNKKNMGDITPEQRDGAIAKAKEILEKGVSASNIPDAIFRNAKIRLDKNGSWTLNGIPWEEARKVTTELARPVDWSKINAPHKGPWPWTNTFGDGQTFRKEVMQWALGRMAGYGTTATIPKINRFGAGADESLTGLEAEGFQYLMHLSEQFPDALWPTKPFTFETKCMALRRDLCARLRNEQPARCEWPVWSSDLALRPTQQMAFEDMMKSHQSGLACFLYMLVGQGKTFSVLYFLESTRDARFIVWSLPKSAVGSVAEMIAEVGWQPLLLFPSSGLQEKYKKEGGKWPSTVSTVLEPTMVTMVEHDHLRSLADPLAPQMCHTAFIFDEVHKAMQSGTQRTASALRLARLAKQLVSLTGTPIIDKTGYGLSEWLRLSVDFPVTASNFWVAANAMVSQLNTGKVQVDDILTQAPETEEESKHLRKGFPSRPPWFGETESPKREDWLEMRQMTMQICDRAIVNLACKMYKQHPKDWRQDHYEALQSLTGEGHGQRPLIVGADQEHAVSLVESLVKKGVCPADIILVGGNRPSGLHAKVGHGKTIHLTEQRVLDGEEYPYKIVVAALRNCEGYSLTWMTCMITGSYPSNQASRTQMRGRINRLDAQRLDKKYHTILAGITTITHRHQEAAKLMEDALRMAPASKKRKI